MADNSKNITNYDTETNKYHATQNRALNNKRENAVNQQQAGAKTAKVAAKVAANYFAPGVGGKIVDMASNTKVGQDFLENAGNKLNRNPITRRTMKSADENGMLDMADKAVDAYGGNKTNLINNKTDNLQDNNKELEKKQTGNAKNEINNDNNDRIDNKGDTLNHVGGKSIFKGVSAGKDNKKNNRVLLFLLKHPWLLLILIPTLLLLMVLLGDDDLNYGSGTDGGISSISCDYNGNDFSDINVELVNCEATSSNYTVLESVPLEKYILGTALAEMGPGNPDESLKAQIIMVRNFTLTRNRSMCPGNPNNCFYGYNPSENKIRLRACENDQVYWDYTKDIYRVAQGGVSKYTPEVNESTPGATLWKSALSKEDQEKYEGLAKDVLGKYAVDANGELYVLGYRDTHTQKAIELGSNGYDYTKIILSIYPEVTAIVTSTCDTDTPEDDTTDIGEYATWKQRDPRWSNIKIGTDTIGNIGCAATSVAIVMARSGVDLTVDNFNPGTFVQAYKKIGGFTGNAIYWDKVHNLTLNNDLHYAYQNAGNYNNDQKKQTIKDLINDGCFLIVQVKSGNNGDTHFVAVDDINTKANNFEKIYMWDPATSATDMFAKYNRSKAWGNRYICYKKN